MDIDAQIAALQALKAQQAQPAAPAPAAAPAQAPAAPAAAFDYRAMAQANAEAFAAAQAAAQQPKPVEQARPHVAAAPSAPSGANLPTENGLVNMWAMDPARVRALGPAFVRENLERAWGIADDMSGRPRKPELPGQLPKKGNR